jgi:hypothetical protein
MAAKLDIEKIIKKHKKHISGWMVGKDGKLVIFMSPGKQAPGELLVALQSANVAYEVRYSDIKLMQFFRPWGGIKGALCSPPVGGYTCHHCASPLNGDRSGQEGVLYDPNTLQVAGSVKILEDYPFHPHGLIEKIIAFFKWIFLGEREVNKYDFAKVDYRDDNGKTMVGVIFAGPSDGSFAIAYDIANAPTGGGNVDSIEKHLDDQLEAVVLHYESNDFHCVMPRRYRVAGKGGATVFAYEYAYYFEPVYYLYAEPATCNGKTITESVRPGYSGSVVYIPS